MQNFYRGEQPVAAWGPPFISMRSMRRVIVAACETEAHQLIHASCLIEAVKGRMNAQIRESLDPRQVGSCANGIGPCPGIDEFHLRWPHIVRVAIEGQDV